MQVDEAKEYSWKWITGDELLSHGRCELCLIVLTSSDGNGDVTLYDGENTNGRQICKFEGLANRSVPFGFHHHIYCRRGLYIDVGSNVTGLLVQWKELGHKGGGN